MLFVLGGQIGFVEAKVHGGFRDRMIVVEIDHPVGEVIDAGVGVGGELLRLVGLLTGGQSLLVRGGGFGIDSLDSLLGALIGIVNAASRLRGLLIQLIDLVYDRGSLLLDIVLGGAACGEGHCAYDKNWEKKAFH